MKTTPLVLAASLLALMACKDKTSRNAESTADPAPLAGQTQPAGAEPVFAVPDTFRNALGQVYDGYTRIQAALAQDDLPGAKEAFSTMHAVLHMLPKEGLDASARAHWDSTDARIMEALHPMAAAESIDSVRAHFQAFSALMADAIRTFGIGGDAPVYRFHCPMAGKNRGADWLQKEKTLRNPYFGKSMQTCGNLVGTLKG